MKRLGELLIEAGALDTAALSHALERQKTSKGRLGEALLQLGLVTEAALLDALARQHGAKRIPDEGLARVDLLRAVLDRVPAALAWQHRIVPLLVDPTGTQLAIVGFSPNDAAVRQAVLAATGMQTIKPHFASRAAMAALLTRCYGPEPRKAAPLPAPVDLQQQVLGATASAVELGAILLVDRDAASASSLELRLVSEGYRVEVASDGAVALDRIRKSARGSLPSLVISEIALPRLDGFGLCLALKADPQTAHLPFLFLSRKDDDLNSNKGLDAGADDFLSKTVHFEFLLKKIELLISKARPAPPPEGVQGRLADIGLLELVQSLALGMRTVGIELSSPRAGAASVVFREGRIVHAHTATHTGEEAFYELATWTDGTFRLVQGAVAGMETIAVSNDYLILESMRLIDESRR